MILDLSRQLLKQGLKDYKKSLFSSRSAHKPEMRLKSLHPKSFVKARRGFAS